MTHKNVYATTFPKILDPSQTCKKNEIEICDQLDRAWLANIEVNI